jgi:hydroxyacylglutathione hydrolase
MMAWRTSGRPIETMDQWSAPRLKAELDRDADLTVLDVRQPSEWHEGHIPGATWITGAALPSRLDELPRDKPVAVICGSGYRSSVAASMLAQRDFPDVFNVLGGMAAWENHGYETEARG